MLEADLVEAEASMKKIRKVCRFIALGLRVILFVYAVYRTVALFNMVTSFVSIDGGSQNIISVVLHLLHGLTIASLLLLFSSIFADTKRGRSPFAMSQVKRLRIIAGLLLLYSIVDFGVTLNTISFQSGSLSSGYVSTNSNVIIPINLAPIFGAAVTFAFSFVFKYGILLQEFTGETL